jgi:hypothetical protein
VTQYSIGLCPVCRQGRLFIYKRRTPQSLYLMCEECFCTFDSPEAAKDGSNCAERTAVEIVPADLEAIEVEGWAAYELKADQS